MDGLQNYQRVERPWGDFERYTLNEPTTVKVLTLKPDQELSLQTHEHRDEFWRILRGSGTVRVGDAETAALEGATFLAPRRTPHRLAAGPEGLSFLEIAFGDFDERDETRLEDDYGRVG